MELSSVYWLLKGMGDGTLIGLLALKGDGRWNSHWSAARYAQNTPSCGSIAWIFQLSGCWGHRQHPGHGTGPYWISIACEMFSVASPVICSFTCDINMYCWYYNNIGNISLSSTSFFWRYIRSERSVILINFCLSIISSNALILIGQTQTRNKVRTEPL